MWVFFTVSHASSIGHLYPQIYTTNDKETQMHQCNTAALSCAMISLSSESKHPPVRNGVICPLDPLYIHTEHIPHSASANRPTNIRGAEVSPSSESIVDTFPSEKCSCFPSFSCTHTHTKNIRAVQMFHYPPNRRELLFRLRNGVAVSPRFHA